MLKATNPILSKVKVEAVHNIESSHFLYHEFSKNPSKSLKKEDEFFQEKNVSVCNEYEMSIIKCKREISDEYAEDEIDHVPLLDRIIKLEQQQKSAHPTIDHMPSCGSSGNFKPFKGSTKTKRISAEYVKPRRSRKTKKTATDSVEIAMGEDAPGLFQAMIDQGVTHDELKIWTSGTEDSPDDLIDEDGFKKLEDIISRVWNKQESLIMLDSPKNKAKKGPSYCLNCLISLVEQIRYLIFKGWPADWGWCRELQSFIFVFERHNRIVLERPEYGYATYFFGIRGEEGVEWQVRRMIRSMKVWRSRSIVVEDKGIVVGRDICEGEAKVLLTYGWLPNTSIATMLNYCDRVIHHRGQDWCDWNTRIHNILMHGFNSGTPLPTYPF